MNTFTENYQTCLFVQANGGNQATLQVCGPYPANASRLAETVRTTYVDCSRRVDLYANASSCEHASIRACAEDALQSPVGIATLGCALWKGMQLVHTSITVPRDNTHPYRQATWRVINCITGGLVMGGAYALGGVPALVTAVGISVLYGVSHGNTVTPTRGLPDPTFQRSQDQLLSNCSTYTTEPPSS